MAGSGPPFKSWTALLRPAAEIAPYVVQVGVVPDDRPLANGFHGRGLVGLADVALGCGQQRAYRWQPRRHRGRRASRQRSETTMLDGAKTVREDFEQDTTD